MRCVVPCCWINGTFHMAPPVQTTTARRPEQIILKQASRGEPSIRAFRACPVHLAVGRPSSLRSAGDMTAFDRLKSTRGLHEPKEACATRHAKKKRHISQLPICDAHLLAINMRPSAQCPVPLKKNLGTPLQASMTCGKVMPQWRLTW